MEQLRQLLLTGVPELMQIQRANHYYPVMGSIAMGELADSPRWAAAWGNKPVADVLSIASMQMAAAGDHVRSLANLLNEPGAYATAAVARAALETAARAFWLLDPAIGVRVRIARGMTLRLHSLRESLKLPLQDSVRRHVQDRIRRIVDGAKTKGLQSGPPGGGKVVWILKPMPSATDAVGDLFPGSDLGQTAYRDLSAAAHGTLWGLVSMLETRGDPVGVHDNLGAPVLSLGTIITRVGVSVLGFVEAADRQLHLYGWDASGWHAWREPALKCLYAMVRSQPTPEAP